MNRYQKFLFGHLSPSGEFDVTCDLIDGSKWGYATFDETTDALTVRQDDDIEITKYLLNLGMEKNDALTEVSVFIDGQWKEILPINDKYVVTTDFDNRVEKIKFSFRNGIADDYILSLIYAEADKEKYYARKVEERKRRLLENAYVKAAVGANLVNVYFQPCCEEYGYTEIDFYVTKNKLEGLTQEWQIITKRQTSEDFYISLAGLAYGEYSFILRQYDKNEHELIESERINFTIR